MDSKSSLTEGLRALQDMFPAVKAASLRAALRLNDGDVNEAAVWLLNEGIAPSLTASFTAETPPDSLASAATSVPPAAPTAAPSRTPSDAPLPRARAPHSAGHPVPSSSSGLSPATFAEVLTCSPLSAAPSTEAQPAAAPAGKSEASISASSKAATQSFESFLFNRASADSTDEQGGLEAVKAGQEHPAARPEASELQSDAEAVARQPDRSSAEVRGRSAHGEGAPDLADGSGLAKLVEALKVDMMQKKAEADTVKAAHEALPPDARGSILVDTDEAAAPATVEGRVADSVATAEAAPVNVLASPIDEPMAEREAVVETKGQVVVDVAEEGVEEADSKGDTTPETHAEAPEKGVQASGEDASDWVVASAHDAGGSGPEKDDGEEAEKVEAEDPMSWSVGSISVLGSQMDINAFSQTSFDSILEESSDLKVGLQQGIRQVALLQQALAEAQAQALQAEVQLEGDKAREHEKREHNEFVMQKARDDLDAHSGDVAAEKGMLNLEARNMLKRLTALNSQKSTLEGEIDELKEVLSARIKAAEERILTAEVEMTGLLAAREERKAEEEKEMAAIVARQKALDDEKTACNELKEFLADRSKAVDSLEGGIDQCADEIKSLRQSILGVPGLADVASGQRLDSLASSLVSVEGTSAAAQAHAGEILSQRAVQSLEENLSMKAHLAGMLSSSSEGSTPQSASAAASAHFDSPMMEASAEEWENNPKEAVLKMLSLLQGSGAGSGMGSFSSRARGSAYEGIHAGEGGLSVGPEVLVPQDSSVVRVSEDDMEDACAKVQGAEGASLPATEGQPGSPERDDGWEDVAYPQAE